MYYLPKLPTFPRILSQVDWEKCPNYPELTICHNYDFLKWIIYIAHIQCLTLGTYLSMFFLQQTILCWVATSCSK